MLTFEATRDARLAYIIPFYGVFGHLVIIFIKLKVNLHGAFQSMRLHYHYVGLIFIQFLGIKVD